MPKLNRKLFAIISMFMLLLISLIAIFGGFTKNVVAADYTGLGEERFSWKREVFEGVELTNIISYNKNKDQKTYTLEFNPKTVNLQPIIAYGGNAMYGSTMTSLIDYEESLGNHVVFGINGDAYDTSNGVANGLVISNGELITSSNAALGWGMLSDGTVKYGSASLQMRAQVVGGELITLKHVNKERKLDTSGVYLLTEKFNDVTASTQAGVEIIMDIIDAHKDKGLRIGQTLSATVKEVRIVQNNPNKNNTPIGKNQVVLATHSSSPQYEYLKGLAVGTQIDFDVKDVSDDRIDWSQVQVGMGIFHLLMENGELTDTAKNDPAVHPRTSMGVKADGTIVLMQNDGRQFGWANGLTFAEMAEYMKGLGVVTLFNFDGGGSSTIQVTLPGEDRAKILNIPSDGSERANTNALLFIAKQEPVEGQPVEKLHIYPAIDKNYSTKTLLLEKSSLKFNVKATDSHFYSVPLTGKTVTYTVENEPGSNIGTINSNGVFTANSGTGKGRVVASVGNVKAYYDIEVVDQITSIETNLTILSIAPGKTAALDFRAYYNSVPVLLSNESLTFTLEPANIGSVSSSGVFTATSGSGTGNLKISYKDYVFTLPVEVGKMPVPIADFETDIFSEGWARYYTNMPGNGGDGLISINRDERYIKHGDGSLRIDYDFATKPLTGTVAIEIGKGSGITLEGQPTAIGAWVYGDGNGGWFRIQLSGGKYAGDTRIDWVGWKYIETPIPTDAPYPYVVQRPVRLLGTATIANNTKGTIYVDSVRAIYDFKNDDNHAPVVEESSIYPANGSTTNDNQQAIGLRVRDAEGSGIIYTGINTSRTQMYINNKLITNIQQTVNQDGSVDIAYVPSALSLLRPGVQHVKVRTEDNFGNKTFTEWTFTLEGYAVSLVEEVPVQDKIYAGQTFEYKLTTPSYKNFSAAELEFKYNFNNLILLDTVIDSRLTVTEKVVDASNGKVKLTILGMENFTYDSDKGFVTLKFIAKETVSGTTGIEVVTSKVTEDSVTTDLVLNGFDVPLDYKNILSFKGSTLGGKTVLTVVSEGNPVEGASFIIKKVGQDFTFTEKTGADGKLTTEIFGEFPIGTEFKIRAIKDGFLSNEITINVVASLGSKTPEKIAITVGEDASTSVGIAFQTNHEVENAKVIISTNADLSSPIEFPASSRIIQTTDGGIDREYTAWGAYVTGLTANTKYYYKVGSDAGWSDVLSFTTAKASGDFNIAFYGDIQGGYTKFPAVVAELYKLYPNIDLSLLAGDVADNGHVYQEWNSLDSNNKQYFNNGIWASAVGNHDTSLGAQAFTGYFYGPNNGVEEPLGGARNYWFEINNAVIFNFDTEAGFNSYDPNYTKQIALLKEVMRNTTKTFKIVLMHRSAYPLNYNEPSIRALAPVFEEAGVDIVLSGHDHVYHRTSMYNGSKVEVQNGVTYVVGGSGSGSKYYAGDMSRPWAHVGYDLDNPVFTVLKFKDGNKVEFEAYAIEASGVKKIDEFSITKFEVDTTISTGGTLVGPKFAKAGNNLNYKVELQQGYALVSVKVDGKDVWFENNEFVVENVKESTKIVVEVAEIKGPIASDLEIVGNLLTGKTIEVKYTYSDTNNKPESGSLISWYVDGNKVGDGKTLTILEAWIGKEIEVHVTPKNATETGIQVRAKSKDVVQRFGDLNGDNQITKDDAMILLQSITGKVTLTDEQKYVANVKDKATLKDVRNILNVLGGN